MNHEFVYNGIVRKDGEDYHTARCKNVYCDCGASAVSSGQSVEEFMESIKNSYEWTYNDIPCPYTKQPELAPQKATIQPSFIFYKTFENTLFLLFKNGEKRLATDIEKEMYVRLSGFEANGKVRKISETLDKVIQKLTVINECQTLISIKEQILDLVDTKKEIDNVLLSIGMEESIDEKSNFRGMTPAEIKERARIDPKWWDENEEIITKAYRKGYVGGQSEWLKTHYEILSDW